MRRINLKSSVESPGFDTAKSKDEKIIEIAVRTLSSTYPEQTYDAMEDYLSIYQLLRRAKYWRLRALLPLIKRLYVYPTRGEHNQLLSEIHDIKEELHEKRIKNTLDGLKLNRQLSGMSKKNPKKLIPLLAFILLIFVLIKI